MQNYQTNEEFLKMIEEKYPNEDWDKLTGVETSPDIFLVEGKHRITNKNGKTYDYIFVRNEEYLTEEEANKAIEMIKKWEPLNFNDEVWVIIPDSIKWRKDKPLEILLKHWYKNILDDIKKGKNVFPMWFP